VPDRVQDEIVERLAETDGVGLDAGSSLSDDRADIRSQQGACGRSLTHETPELHVLEPDRGHRGVPHDTLDCPTCGDGKVCERLPLTRVDRRLRVDGRDRSERGDGTA
jgi:hypothetical protein